jgi:hypothetical protein
MANDKPTITPLDGKTTVDDKVRFEPECLSYQSANFVAERIAQRVREDLKGRPVVIVDTSAVTDIANLEASFFELRQLVDDYEALAERAVQLHRVRSEASLDKDDTRRTKVEQVPDSGVLLENFIAPIPAITAITTVLSAGIGLASLFRQDVELHGTETSVDSLTFKIALAEQLRVTTSVYIAELYLPTSRALAKSDLRSQMEKVRAARAKIWGIVSPMISIIVRLDTQLDRAAKNKDQKKLDEVSALINALRRDLQPVTDSLKEIDNRLAALEKLWAQVDSGTGLTVLARMLRAEALRSFGAPLLHAAIVASGGNTRTIRNLWRTLWSGDGVSFSGGAVARWALLDANGVFIKGGIEAANATYKDDRPVSIRFSEGEAMANIALRQQPISVSQQDQDSADKEIPTQAPQSA